MKWLAMVAASALVRRLVYLAVAVVIGFFATVGKAHAATEAEAIAQCMAALDSDDICHGPYGTTDSTPDTGYYSESVNCAGHVDGEPDFRPSLYVPNDHGNCNSLVNYSFTSRCPSGVDYENAACFPEGPTDEECLAINAQPGFINVGPVSRSFLSECRANGCVYERVEPGPSVCAGSVCNYTGVYEWTGACPAPPPPEAEEPEVLKDPPPQTCIAGTSPQVCIKKTGEHCFAASTGEQLCWRPGETGTKTNKNVAQVRAPGTQAPPAPTPPPGETFTPGPSVTTATDTGTGNTFNTTTVNYITTGGTDAGADDDGEPADGSGGEGEGDEEGNGVAGSGDCEAGWLPSGDPVLGAILTEAHATRCAGEEADANNRSDADAFGAAADGLEDANGTIWQDGTPASGALNESFLTWGSGACPIADLTFSMGQMTFTPPPEFCTIGQALAALFTLIAYVWAIRIISE